MKLTLNRILIIVRKKSDNLLSLCFSRTRHVRANDTDLAHFESVDLRGPEFQLLVARTSAKLAARRHIGDAVCRARKARLPIPATVSGEYTHAGEI